MINATHYVLDLKTIGKDKTAACAIGGVSIENLKITGSLHCASPEEQLVPVRAGFSHHDRLTEIYSQTKVHRKELEIFLDMFQQLFNCLKASISLSWKFAGITLRHALLALVNKDPKCMPIFRNCQLPAGIKIVVEVHNCTTMYPIEKLNCCGVRGGGFILFQLINQLSKNLASFIKKPIQSLCSSGLHSLRILLTQESRLHSLALKYFYSSKNCSYGTNRLNPSRLIVNTKMIEHVKERPAQNTNTEESPYHPDTRNFHRLRNLEHLELPTILAISFASLNIFPAHVHGEAA